MPDLSIEEVEAALDAYDVIDRKGVNVPPPPQELVMRKAAHAYLRLMGEGEKVWWCENHETGPCAPHEAEVTHCFTGHAMNGGDTCRMVSRILIDPEGGG